MNRRSFTKLLLPILSLGLIKQKEDKLVTFKEANNKWGTIGAGLVFDGKEKLISIRNFSGTSNHGKWIVYSLDC